ncbi:MAG: tyrosine-type recombinase/integrase [Chloroflexi bacterium]|nr:tyrosine-type recombinase/integrase [Chloroflexota bacterium]
MNCSSLGLKASNALLGFMQYKTAEGLSPNTLISYEHLLKTWVLQVGDVTIDKITTQDLCTHLAWLRTEYKPRRFSGSSHPLSSKSIRNTWIALSAFFTWASREFNFANPMKAVPAPKFEEPPIEPFTKEQIETILKASEYSREAHTDKRKKFVKRRETARRDRAIVLFLLDTGLRASEICSLTIGDVEQKTGRVEIKHGTMGGAKGGKGRVVFLGKTARSALWRYLIERADGTDPSEPLFTERTGRPLNKTALRELLTDLGKKVNIRKCHPHRFRHTFAITYLRNGGDLFTLKALLGHSTLEMVQHYARIAEVDVAQAHRRASPADNWHL